MAEEVQVLLVSSGYQLREWSEYSINSNYMTPTDGWSMAIAVDRLPAQARVGLSPGSEVKLISNGEIILRGYIDARKPKVSRSEGTIWHITGRDILSPVVDASVSPKFRLKVGMTLYDALVQLFEPFYIKVIADADAYDVLVGGTVTRRRAVPQPMYASIIDPLKPLTIDQNNRAQQLNPTPVKYVPYTVTIKAGGRQKRVGKCRKIDTGDLKPHSGEGTFEFANRLCHRFGLMLHLSPFLADDAVYCTAPNFTQDSVGTIARFRGAERAAYSNILDGEPEEDVSEQPSFIYAEGVGGGKEFGKSKLKAFIRNPFITVPGFDPIADLQKQFPGVREVSTANYPITPISIPYARGLYLHDEDARNEKELEQFLKMELAKRTRKSLTAKYTVAGHLNPQGVPWQPDTVVDVIDEPCDFRERLWVLGRTFKRSRSGGTTTDLELIRLFSLEI